MRCLEQLNSWTQKVEWGLPGAGVRGDELRFHGDIVSAWKDDKVLETDGGDGCTTM